MKKRHNLPNNKYILNFLIATIVGVAYVILSLNKGVLFVPDSSGYIDSHIIRSPLYPLFLKLSNVLTPSSLTVTIILQHILGLISSATLSLKIKKFFKLNSILVYFIFGILISPYLYLHFIGNTIASEAISYPLYLLIIAFLLEYIFRKSQKYIYIVFFIWLLLLLTRSQFLYFVAIFILLFSFNYYHTKSFRVFLINCILCLLVPILFVTIDKTYHKIQHGHFVSTPWKGQIFSTLPFFVSDPQDVNILNTELEKEYFDYISKELIRIKCNINNLPQEINSSNIITYYVGNYGKISTETLSNKGGAFFTQKGYSENESYIMNSKTTLSIGFQLIIANKSKWLNLYIKNVVHGLGTKLNALQWLFILVLSIILLIKGNNNNLYLFITLISLSLILNTLTVAVMVQTLKRLLLYNNWIIFFILGALFSSTSFSPKSQDTVERL